MKKMQGFTLIELLIVVAIIAILAAIAIPQYQDYISRARASGAVAELSGLRTAVAVCMSERQTAVGCDLGAFGIPATVNRTENVRTDLAATTVVSGVITSTTGATQSNGGTHLTYINTPTAVANSSTITWLNTGSLCAFQNRGLRPGQGDCP